MPERSPTPRRGPRDMSRPTQEWRFEVGSPDDGSRLDSFLAARLSWRSRRSIQDAIGEGRVEIEPLEDARRAPIGRVRPGSRLRAGQRVVVRLPAAHAEEGALAAAGDEVPVVFEDDWLLAVDKPPAMSVYPTRRYRAGSLVETVHRQHSERHRAVDYPPSLCHRLDRDTSGLVLFALDLVSRAAVSAQFEERRVEKVYLGLVAGEVGPEAGRIELALGRDPESRVEIRMAPRADGAPAATVFQVVERLAGLTLVELVPETGRQHQLRAHLAAIGHPLLGDRLYRGGDEVFLRSLAGELSARDARRLGHARQALHAWRLTLDHPDSGERITLEAPLARDLERLLEAARRGRGAGDEIT